MTRPRIMELLLRANYTLFYNDVDTVWCHNAWEYLDENLLVDNGNNNVSTGSSFAYAMDGSTIKLCTCLLYMTPVDANLELLQEWQSTPMPKGKHDQTAFNKMMRKKRFHGHTLDPSKFPPGSRVDWKNRTLNLQDRYEYILHTNYMYFPSKQTSMESAGAWDPSQQITDTQLEETCNSDDST